MNLRETAEYKEHGFKIVTCPVCGNETLDMYWICEHCGWEYDYTKSEDEYLTQTAVQLKNIEKIFKLIKAY